MTLEHLDSLVKARSLKEEPPDQGQIDGMIGLAKIRLTDTEVRGLSEEGRFSSAYGAAHSLALAARLEESNESQNMNSDPAIFAISVRS